MSGWHRRSGQSEEEIDKRECLRDNRDQLDRTGFLSKLDIFSEKALGSFEDGVICPVSVVAVLRMDSGGPRKNTK